MRYTIFFLVTQKADSDIPKHFKYLGSDISYSLHQEDYDIKSRIAAATKAFGVLTKFWNNRMLTPTQIPHLPSSEPFQ